MHEKRSLLTLTFYNISSPAFGPLRAKRSKNIAPESRPVRATEYSRGRLCGGFGGGFNWHGPPVCDKLISIRSKLARLLRSVEIIVTKVSVIIPTHSRPHLLSRAVASAQEAGRDVDVEVIIVDDASTDTTARVGAELENRACVRYIRLERNQGVAGARNVGLMASAGEYIAFLDDDDLRLPGSLDLQIAALQAYPEAGLACGTILVGDQDCELTDTSYGAQQESGDLFWDMVSLSVPILPIAVVAKRECFLRAGMFDSKIAGIDDWDMWTRISELYPVVIVREPVCIYRTPLPDSGQGSSNLARHMAWASRHQLKLFKLKRAREGTASQRDEARRQFLENITNHLVHHAAMWAQDGARRHARANLMMALRLNPRRALKIRAPGVRHYARLLWQKPKPAPEEISAEVSPTSPASTTPLSSSPERSV
jgi:glycosyltransferase involved in cell wall biosynthesis